MKEFLINTLVLTSFFVSILFVISCIIFPSKQLYTAKYKVGDCAGWYYDADEFTKERLFAVDKIIKVGKTAYMLNSEFSPNRDVEEIKIYDSITEKIDCKGNWE